MRTAVFLAVVTGAVGGIHFYLWRRLVADTTRRGSAARRVGTLTAVALALLVPATLLLTRDGPTWIAWGYLWVALMFYLLVGLLLLELPVGLALWWRRRRAAPRAELTAPATVAVAAEPVPVATTAPGRRPTTHAAPPGPGPGAGAPSPDRCVPSPDRCGPSPGAGAGGTEAGVGRPADTAHSGPAARTGPGNAASDTAHSDSTADTPASEPPADTADSGPAAEIAHSDSAADTAHSDSAADTPASEPPTDTARRRPAAETGPGDAAVRAGVPDPQRRLLLRRGAAIMAGLAATGVTGYGVRTALGPPQLDRVQVPLAKLPRRMDGFRIAVVSDIHLGPLNGRAHTARIVDAINGLDADAVAIVGDLVDGTVAELGAAAAPLRGLRSRRGTFFVTGNHEFFSGVVPWLEELPRLGVRVLANERLAIDGLDLAGVHDLAGGEPQGFGPHPAPMGPDFAATFADRDPARPVVLLAHQPVQAREAARYGVDLQLSGHTHGGQMAPFNLLVALEQPVVSGLGDVDGTQVYVTNGAGFWGPPVRVGAPPQISLVQLRATG